MYILKVGEGCVLKMRLVEANGAPIELRNARFVQAILHLPNEATMLCEDVRFDEVSQLVFVRLSAKSELTMEGVYGININALFDGRVVTSAVLDFAEVKSNAESRYFELLIDLLVSTTDVPSCVKYTGASPKISENGTWLVFNDEINAFEDTGISIFGKSAYQAAIESGNFSGTEEEFNAYMGCIPQITNDAILATDAANEAAENANKAGAEAVRIATDAANEAAENANKAGAEAVRIATDAANEATTAKENAEQATEQATEATANANNAAQRANEEVENLREKADIDKYYPLMSVGMADNLVGRGDVQDAQINFRPSAGADNITDGAARIERIKGNSVVWNQGITSLISKNAGNVLVKNGVTFEKISDKSYHISGDNNTTSYAFSNESGNLSVQTNHYYLFDIVGCDKSYINIYLPNIGFALNGRISEIKQSKIDGNAIIRLTVASNTPEINEYVSCQVIDLTKMFGAGYEPTTVEEYYQRKPMNIEDEFAYNEGELIDMKVDSLISISDNAYDYTKGYAKVMGGHTYSISANDAYIPDEVLFSTNADEWDEALTYNEEGVYNIPRDGYVKPIFLDVDDNLNICVCLQHSYDKPHPPYQQEVKDLSFIGEEFSEGMRCIPPFKDDIGIIVISEYIFDEIRFNTAKKVWEKIIRIGVVDLGNLSWVASSSTGYAGSFRAAFAGAKNYALFSPMYVPQFKSNQTTTWIPERHHFRANIYNGNIGVNNPDYTDVTTFTQAMKGVLLYYELAEPIIEEIEGSENWNLDYLVWDFGTEEAIASVPSAPFRADINYEPNAVDDLRWAVAEIRSLRAQIAQLQSSQVSDTNLME